MRWRAGAPPWSRPWSIVSIATVLLWVAPFAVSGTGSAALAQASPDSVPQEQPASPEQVPAGVPAESVPATLPAEPSGAPVSVEIPPLGGGELLGPIVSVDAAEISLGGRATVTLDGFGSAWATVTVCGNEARRGSQDCDQSSSVAKEFPPDGSPILLSYVVNAPPVPCPCVLRAVGRDTSEVAISPITLTGHSVGPLVDPVVVGELVEVTIEAHPRSSGVLDALRAELGGRTAYEVTVSVRNTSTTGLRDVRLAGSVQRGNENLGDLLLDDPGALGVGQTWRQTVVAEVPSPSFGEVEWHVLANGAGPAVAAVRMTSHRPWLFISLVLLIVLNICILLLRWRVRRRRERAAALIEVGELVDAERSPSGGSYARDSPVEVPVGADR